MRISTSARLSSLCLSKEIISPALSSWCLVSSLRSKCAIGPKAQQTIGNGQALYGTPLASFNSKLVKFRTLPNPSLSKKLWITDVNTPLYVFNVAGFKNLAATSLGGNSVLNYSYNLLHLRLLPKNLSKQSKSSTPSLATAVRLQTLTS